MRTPSGLRAAVLTAATALLLAACGGGSDDTPAASGSPGPAAAADPGVVVALDDFAAANVLALGVTPDLAFDTFGYTTSAALYAEAGITAKPYGQELDIEQVVAAEPDVIIGTSLPTTVAQKGTLERLGRTAILDYTGDWKSALRATGAALGRSERAALIESRISANIAALKTDLAAAGKAGTVSVIAGSADDFFSPPAKTNLGSLLAGLGLDRPAPQKADVPATSPFISISAENLTANDGDALYLLAGRTYPVARITSSPLYGRLKAVQDKRAFQVSGEMWFGSNPLSVQWVLDDVRATLLDGGAPLRESQAGDRLKQLTAWT